MKIFAFANVYNECDWLLHHIAHIYPWVDHILIHEGNNSPPVEEIPARSEDGTIELCHYLDKRLKKVRFLGSGNVHKSNKKGQAETFQHFLDTAWTMGAKEEDWIFLADPDEIMTDWFFEGLKNLLGELGDKFSALETYGPMFWFNMKLFIWQHRERMWRFRKDAYFGETIEYRLRSTHRPVNHKRELVMQIGGVGTPSNYHYAFVKPPSRELTRRKWEVACGYREPIILDWYREVFMKWNYADMGETAYLTNKKLTGNKGILFKGNDQLMTWHVKHPKIIEKHPMKKIDDIREIRETRVIIKDERIFHHILKLDDFLFTTELTPLLKGLK